MRWRWAARPLRPGDLVEVRSEAEILATLDASGRLDGLPFMPEMLQYCGWRLRVARRADKTCDTVRRGGRLRRLRGTVHLEGARCDGSAHGGCQASCLLFWKEAWLRRVRSGPVDRPWRDDGEPAPAASAACLCTREALRAATRRGATGTARPVFACQATELPRASTPLRWWDPRPYARDLRCGNVGVATAAAGFLIAAFNALQRHRGGGTYPPLPPGSRNGSTPSERLDLQPGERVQVKSADEIGRTLDAGLRNRGLSFDVEMSPYCGRTFRVLRRVERLIDERTGEMIDLRNDCVILDGVTCSGLLSRGRLFCPRAIYPFWREIWLRRVPSPLVADPPRAVEPAPATALRPFLAYLLTRAGSLLGAHRGRPAVPADAPDGRGVPLRARE